MEGGRILVRKRAIDYGGKPVRADLEGVTFQVTTPDGELVGSEFQTNRTGIAMSELMPVLENYVLRETFTPSHLEPGPHVPFRLVRPEQVVEITNRLRPDRGFRTRLSQLGWLTRRPSA